MTTISKTDEDWQEGKSITGGAYRFRDLSGEHLGARIEELPPGSTSSEHHYHTAEEEHILVLEGAATLHVGEAQYPLTVGDHVCFKAGDETAHHIENTTDTAFRFLVYGERKADDVVVYPEHQVMMVKALDRKLFTYRPVQNEDSSE